MVAGKKKTASRSADLSQFLAIVEQAARRKLFKDTGGRFDALGGYSFEANASYGGGLSCPPTPKYL